jgi:hypothetical protein
MDNRAMRLLLIAAALFACACSSPQPNPSPEPAPKAAEAPKPRDETRRFPLANQVDTKVVDTRLMGKDFMPGGTIAHYKKGKLEYDMFVARMASANQAAITLPDWQKALANAKLVPSFGGYFGEDNGRPVFVFSKEAWIAGIAGLPEKQADLEARTLASRLD